MGVVICPCAHGNFDGRIMLERVSNEQVVTKLTAHTSFSDNVHTYESRNSGD